MKISELPFCSRFVFNCSDGFGFSTVNIEDFRQFKNKKDVFPISQLKPGEILSIKRAGFDTPVKYKITKIEVRDIKYDTEENHNFSFMSGTEYFNDGKLILMVILVFMDLVNEN